MKTITAKTADLSQAAESIYANVYTAEGAAEVAKVRRMAAKMNVSFEDALLAMLVKSIKYGAVKINAYWYPVVDAKVRPSGYTFSSGALSDAVHCAGQLGVALRV